MKILFTLSIVILCTMCAMAQPSNIVSASGSKTSSTLQVDWTLGELFVESSKAATVQLQSGVGAINAVLIVTGDLPKTDDLTDVYPIPFRDEFYIEANTDEAISFSLYDTNGKKIELPYEVIGRKIKVDTGALQSGFYLLMLPTKKTNTVQPVKLIKQ